MVRMILLIVGLLGLLLGVGTLIVMIFLVSGGGHVDMEEALPGFIGGCFCSFVSLVLAVIGLVMVLKNRKPPASSAYPPTTPPMPPSP
jgi:hypothetical protein